MDNNNNIFVNGRIAVKWDGKISRCNKCGAEIGWGITEKGKKLPFDLKSDMFTAHFATCPNYKKVEQKEDKQQKIF